jgi:ADP-heptose:LPS heptosyltransferase
MRGDILACTAIIRAIKQKYPGGAIFFKTDYPGVLANNPHLHATAQAMQHNYADTWNLGNFADNRGKHLIDIMAAGFFKPGEVEKRIEIFPKQCDHDWAAQRMPNSAAIVIAPGPGKWRGKNWSQAKWNGVIEALLPNYPVVVVGTKDQNSYRLLPQVFDLRGETNEMQLAAIIYQAKLFVGLDGFPLHVAGAVRTPRVGIFGVTKPDLIMCDAPYRAVCSDPDHPLTSTRHRVGSITELGRKFPDPMETISPELVLRVIHETLS